MESIPLDFTETPAVENNKYGEKMQFDASGPYQKTRTKTDFCWLIGFIIYLVIWIVIIIYAFATGDTSKGLKPRDSTGRICGYDPGVENKPYLVRYNPGNCDMKSCLLCQSDCPKKDFDFADYDRRSKRSTDDDNPDQSGKENLPVEKTLSNDGLEKEDKDSLDVNGKKSENNERELEDSERNVKNKDLNDKKQNLNDDEKDSRDSDKNSNGNEEDLNNNKKTLDGNEKKLDDKEQKLDSADNLPTTSTTTSTTKSPSADNTNTHEYSSKFDEAIKNIICQSDVNLDLIKRMDKLRYFVDHGKCSRTYKKTDQNQIYGYRCGFDEDFNSTFSGRQFEKSSITRDLYKAKYSVMGFIMLSGLIALASIFLMRWYALAYVCISIFVICAVAFHYIYEKCVLNAESKTNGVLLALFLGVVALVVIVLIAIYFRKELGLACQMIKESCKAITCVLSSLAVPFFFFLIYTMFFILGVSTYYLLSSLESSVYQVQLADDEKCDCPSNLGYSQNATCDPATFSNECQQETGAPCILSGCYMVKKKLRNMGFLHFINWVGLVWSFLFITGFNDIVLASVFSTWYWTFNKKILSYLTVIESFWRITTYHLGTVALGSLLILICTIVKAIVNSMKRSLKKSNRPCGAVILLSLKCVFDMVENCIEFINRRAYIMCAMHGTDFFQSARTAYYLFMRNVERVIAVVVATNWLTFITNVLIACVTTRIAISYYDAYRADDLSHITMPVTLIFLGSLAICSMFMRVIEIAVDTVFVCFLEDTERNDGTNEKPYFMSEELTRFLYRK